jgi:hypothetical protein
VSLPDLTPTGKHVRDLLPKLTATRAPIIFARIDGFEAAQPSVSRFRRLVRRINSQLPRVIVRFGPKPPPHRCRSYGWDDW